MSKFMTCVVLTDEEVELIHAKDELYLLKKLQERAIYETILEELFSIGVSDQDLGTIDDLVQLQLEHEYAFGTKVQVFKGQSLKF